MVALVAEQTKLLRYADAARQDPELLSDFDLWRLAARTASSRGARMLAYRHALLHAGRLPTSRGVAYRRCPICRTKLAPPIE